MKRCPRSSRGDTLSRYTRLRDNRPPKRTSRRRHTARNVHHRNPHRFRSHFAYRRCNSVRRTRSQDRPQSYNLPGCGSSALACTGRMCRHRSRCRPLRHFVCGHRNSSSDTCPQYKRHFDSPVRGCKYCLPRNAHKYTHRSPRPTRRHWSHHRCTPASAHLYLAHHRRPAVTLVTSCPYRPPIAAEDLPVRRRESPAQSSSVLEPEGNARALCLKTVVLAARKLNHQPHHARGCQGRP